MTGTTDWARYSIELTVDASDKNINSGRLPGNGTAWFDGLTIELDGEAFTDAVRNGFRFRVRVARGFFHRWSGYRVAIDNALATQENRAFACNGAGGRCSRTASERVHRCSVAEWKEVVSHLDETRAGTARPALPNGTSSGRYRTHASYCKPCR